MLAQIKNQLAYGLMLILLFAPGLSFATDVEAVRVWRAPDHTRIVLDLSAPVEHSLATLTEPHRLVLFVPSTQLKTNFNALPLADTPVTAIRASQDGPDLRIVFDLKEAKESRSFFLKKHGDKGDRLVIDLLDGNAPEVVQKAVTAPPPVVTAKPVVQSPANKPPTVAASSTKQASGPQRNIIIAIDAGHGGEDPGAIGPNRQREKDVTLAISKQLVALINAERGFEAKLVRTGDYFIPLKKRRDIARNMKADLFVSIHADAFTKPSARGASVFALSRTGATSETARFLAQRENESDLIGGVGGISLEDKDQVLAGVLVDLSMTSTLNDSLRVGQQVLTSMGQIAVLHKRQVEQAGFMVLKSPDVPSILIETGFISNPEEARKLTAPAYQKQMAQSVFRGVRNYFLQSPPPATYLASQRDSGAQMVSEHVIAPGDTLSGISRRYNVSVNQLLAHNNLSNTTVKVGQTLKIPAS